LTSLQIGVSSKKERLLRRNSMSRLRTAVVLSLLSFVFVLAGCAKSSNQSATSDATSPSSPSSSSSASKESAPRPRPIVVPADTPISVVLDETVGSKISTSGQTFAATVETPVEVSGRVVIPKGARASGIVTDAKAAGRFKGGAALELTLTSVRLDDKYFEIQTSAPVLTTKGKGKRTAAMVGGGAGGGAAIGAVAGGGKGAAIGALIGAAAGTGGAGLTGNRDITLPVETRLTFKLLQPLEIRPR
jgi:hypothetical protein